MRRDEVGLAQLHIAVKESFRGVEHDCEGFMFAEWRVFAIWVKKRTPGSMIALRFSSAARRLDSMKGSFPGLSFSEEKHGILLLEPWRNVARHLCQLPKNNRTVVSNCLVKVINYFRYNMVLDG